MSGLRAVVYGRCSSQGAPDDLWIASMQEGVAPQGVCAVEQGEHRLFHG